VFSSTAETKEESWTKNNNVNHSLYKIKHLQNLGKYPDKIFQQFAGACRAMTILARKILNDHLTVPTATPVVDIKKMHTVKMAPSK
jgi:DNA-binding FrmR family transcriptional regulator